VSEVIDVHTSSFQAAWPCELVFRICRRPEFSLHAARVFASFYKRFQETIKIGSLDTDAGYLSRLEMQRTIWSLLIELMDRYSLEALVYPVKALPAPMLGSGDEGPRDNAFSSTPGLPAIVLPAGLNEDGLALALEFLGRPFSEPTLLQIADAYERASHARVASKTTPHLPGEVLTYK
jgi:Asp-tRNA(Asn)/Glu-tRNA(Gln) amidotransferase A subunit family amidase